MIAQNNAVINFVLSIKREERNFSLLFLSSMKELSNGNRKNLRFSKFFISSIFISILDTTI